MPFFNRPCQRNGVSLDTFPSDTDTLIRVFLNAHIMQFKVYYSSIVLPYTTIYRPGSDPACIIAAFCSWNLLPNRS